MKRLIVVRGTMGVGKTAVCRELQGLLPDCVFLDGDWCWDASPFVVTEETKTMVMDNIAFLLGSFLRCSAYAHIVFCWVLHEWSIVEELLGRLEREDCLTCVVTLTSTEEALRARLQEDIAAGRRSPDIIERSLARRPCYRAGEGLPLDVSRISAAAAARRIVQLLNGKESP